MLSSSPMVDKQSLAVPLVAVAMVEKTMAFQRLSLQKRANH